MGKKTISAKEKAKLRRNPERTPQEVAETVIKAQ